MENGQKLKFKNGLDTDDKPSPLPSDYVIPKLLMKHIKMNYPIDVYFKALCYQQLKTDEVTDKLFSHEDFGLPIWKNAGYEFYNPNINQNPTKMEAQEFEKLVKKSKSAKDLVIGYMKKDYKPELNKLEKEVKELNKKIDFLKSLNFETGTEYMNREQQLEKKRVDTKNSALMKEIDRLKEIKNNLFKGHIPPYEYEAKNTTESIFDQISKHIYFLDAQIINNLYQFSDFYKFIEGKIIANENEVSTLIFQIEYLQREQQINDHLCSVLTQAFKR